MHTAGRGAAGRTAEDGDGIQIAARAERPRDVAGNTRPIPTQGTLESIRHWVVRPAHGAGQALAHGRPDRPTDSGSGGDDSSLLPVDSVSVALCDLEALDRQLLAEADGDFLRGLPE
ncbi:hypothetical protein EB73_07665 [Mycobacterium sp. SWH-M3]|nr:hypothetical protein EB73_07665 [Mycobacterium sp. SWH-M3]